ncbi:MAG: alkaline phosphatase family protein [Gemmatimonadota bacterium]|nr:alkaline phosphatase family protein [Gemmatimonadota bacterium]
MGQSRFSRCIFLLVDGARADVVQEMFESDELPNLKKYIVDPGTYQTAVTVFPSTTGPAHAPFITGCTPGSCNIPGIRWFDRHQPGERSHYQQSRSYVGPGSLYMDADLTPGIRTIFEYFDNPAGVFSFLNRGLGLTQNRTLLHKSWYWFYAHYTGHWQAVDDAAWRHIEKAVNGGSDFIFAVLPAVDEYSHHTHPFSEVTREAYRKVDQGFGRLVDQLHRRNMLDDTLFVLSSDHGLTTTHTHFELWRYLDECGLKTVYYPKILQRGCNAASMISGNGMSQVYLKFGDTWNLRPTYQDICDGLVGDGNLIDDLVKQEAVDLVAVRNGNGGVIACSRSGRAEILARDGLVHYHPIEGDPFGYEPLVPWMTMDESLEATFDTDYPDAPYQLLTLMQSPRCGDIVVSARKGYDLRKLYEHPEHHASHGSLHRDHMHVPLMINEEVHRPYVRTVDVFTSMLELMGHSSQEMIDGQSFVTRTYAQGVDA